MGKHLTSSGTVRRMRMRKYLTYVLLFNVMLVGALALLYCTPAINVNVYIENYFVGSKLQSSSAFTVVERAGHAPRVIDLVLRKPASLPHPPHPSHALLHKHQPPQIPAAAEAKAAHALQQQQPPAEGSEKTMKTVSETWAIELELQIK